jgi:hypothetical protein
VLCWWLLVGWLVVLNKCQLSLVAFAGRKEKRRKYQIPNGLLLPWHHHQIIIDFKILFGRILALH